MAERVGEVRTFLASGRAERLDRYLAQVCPDISRSRIARLAREGRAMVNGLPARPAQPVKPGDAVALSIPPVEPSPLAAEPIPIGVVYQDRDIMVVDKPPGMAVHPSSGHASGTLVNALLAACPDLSGIGGEARPGIVHRLDKDTSGLIVVAKHDTAHRAVAAQLKERAVEKVYLALVWGCPSPAEGWIEGPIGRDPHNRKRMAVVSGGRCARTGYRTLRCYGGTALAEVRPETGRTHQIRVHMAYAGHPVVGDSLYGRGRTVLAPRQFLHAHRLRFRLPSTGEPVEFTSPLPPDLQEALERLEAALPGGGRGTA